MQLWKDLWFRTWWHLSKVLLHPPSDSPRHCLPRRPCRRRGRVSSGEWFSARQEWSRTLAAPTRSTCRCHISQSYDNRNVHMTQNHRNKWANLMIKSNMNIKIDITSRSPPEEHFGQPTDLKIRFLLNSTILCSVGLQNMENTVFSISIHSTQTQEKYFWRKTWLIFLFSLLDWIFSLNQYWGYSCHVCPCFILGECSLYSVRLWSGPWKLGEILAE